MIDIIFHKYEVFVTYEDSDGVQFIGSSTQLEPAIKLFEDTVKDYTITGVISSHFRISLLDIDRDSEIKSYDSRTDVC